jgi:hypothetical protein
LKACRKKSLVAFIGATLSSFLLANVAAVTFGSLAKAMAQVQKVSIDVLHLPAISLDIDDVHCVPHPLAPGPQQELAAFKLKAPVSLMGLIPLRAGGCLIGATYIVTWSRMKLASSDFIDVSSRKWTYKM